MSLLLGLHHHTPPTSRLSAPPGVYEQVPLQPGLQARSQSGCGRVGQQSQFVENTSAKVVSNHREAVIGALELQGKRRVASQKPTGRASLVAQQLRICLLMQGTQVRALVREDPTCRRATKPVRHNY